MSQVTTKVRRIENFPCEAFRQPEIFAEIPAKAQILEHLFFKFS